jgi:predicted dehydrogenase
MKSISVIGLGHAFNHQYEALKKYFNNIELCDIDLNKIKKYGAINDYKLLNSPTTLISTSPKNHLSIIKDLINKTIILEKPMVMNLDELNELISINNSNIYSSLHYSFGKEIDYFINMNYGKPKSIYSYISDNYVTDNHINTEQINLCGSYLDEVINPLSALGRIFGYNIKFIKNNKKFYDGDRYDYYSKSEFNIDGIKTIIEVEWNNKKSQKYIDLIYEDKTIRLDSMNQEVIDLTNNKVMYEACGDRMFNHYLGVLNDYITNNNFDKSVILHQELLKGV